MTFNDTSSSQISYLRLLRLICGNPRVVDGCHPFTFPEAIQEQPSLVILGINLVFPSNMCKGKRICMTMIFLLSYQRDVL